MITKNNIMFLMIFVFMMIGCENRDSNTTPSQNVTPKEEVIIIPTYDLSEYIFPDINQSNFYQENMFEKSDISARYRDSNETLYYDDSYTTTSSLVELVKDGIHEFDYLVEADTITSLDLFTNKSSLINRVVQVGDVITDELTDEIIDGLDNVSEYICTIDKYIDTKMTDNNTKSIYTDVLQKSCIKTYYASGTVYKKDIKIEGTTEEVYFYARGVGLISSTTEDCQKSTFDSSLPTYSCVKREANLIYQKAF